MTLEELRAAKEKIIGATNAMKAQNDQLLNDNANLTKQVADFDVKIAELELVIQRKDNELAAIDNKYALELQAKDLEIAALIDAHAFEIASKEQELEALRAQVDAAQKEVNELLEKIAVMEEVIVTLQGLLGL